MYARFLLRRGRGIVADFGARAGSDGTGRQKRVPGVLYGAAKRAGSWLSPSGDPAATEGGGAPRYVAVQAARPSVLLETLYACGLQRLGAVRPDTAARWIYHTNTCCGRWAKARKSAWCRLPQVLWGLVAPLRANEARPSLLRGRAVSRSFFLWARRAADVTRQQVWELVRRSALGAGHRQAGDAAHAAAHVRHSPLGKRGRSALDPGNARPRECRHDTAVHGGGCDAPSAGLR